MNDSTRVVAPVSHRRMPRALAAVLILALAGLARPAAAQLKVTGARPILGQICDGDACSFLTSTALDRELRVLGFPLDIWDICGDRWFDCQQGSAGWVYFNFPGGGGTTNWYPDVAQPMSWGTQVGPGQPGGLPYFSCMKLNQAVWNCSTGTWNGRPWTFNVWYRVSWL